jgi:hypothetical protein
MELIPDIESGIPIPLKSSKTSPEMTSSEELQARVNTIKYLSDLAGTPIVPNSEHQTVAEGLAKQMLTDPQTRPDFAKYPNETMAYLAGMVAQSNCMIVDELSELKLYVVNKLVFEVENAATAKDRIAALKSLGEIDGVDAFKKRTETTIKVQPIEEVEKELLTILDGVEYAEITELSEETPE